MRVRALQTGSAGLAIAALVAIGQTPATIAVHDGATTVASAHPAVPTEWSNAGPLAVPTIGVFPPGTEDWFNPQAEPPVPAQSPPWSATTFPSTMEGPGADEPGTDVPATPVDTTPTGATLPATTEAPQRTDTPPTDAALSPTRTPGATTIPGISTSRTTTPDTTTPDTTTPETPTPTPETPTPETPTPETPTPTKAPELTTPGTTSPSSTTPDRTEPAPSSATNARGNVALAFGEQLTVVDDGTGAAALAIAVDGVTTDVVCTAPDSAPAANGHLVALHLRVITGADLSAIGGEPAINATDFRFLGDGPGTLVEAAPPSAGSCLTAEEAFAAGPLPPGQEVTGDVVLDVPALTGTFVYTPGFLAHGAEWAY